MRGKLSVEWNTHQQVHLRKLGKQNKCNPMLTFLSQLWTSIMQGLWKGRNDARHGADQAKAASITRDKLRRELQVMYDKRHLLHEEDRDIFRSTLDIHMEESTTRIKNWLTSYQPLVLYSVEAAEKAAKEGSKQLTTMFKRLPRRHKRRKRQRTAKDTHRVKSLVDKPITQFFPRLVWEIPKAYNLLNALDRNIQSNHPG